MEEREIFIEAVNKLSEHGIHMVGTLVYYHNEARFNIEGFNFAYNMMRLGKLIDKVVDFR